MPAGSTARPSRRVATRTGSAAVEDDAMTHPSPARLAAFTRLDRLFRLRAWLRRPAPTPAKVRLTAEPLEDRVVPDGRPLPYPVIYAGADAGMAPEVRAYDAVTGKLNFTRTVYESTFTGGVRVAAADLTGDGFPDLVVAPGAGGGPRVRVLDGKTGSQIPGPLGSFYAYEPGFAGGVYVAAADADGDGRADIVTSAGMGGSSRVRVFSGKTGAVLSDFLAYEPEFRGGATVAAADLTGDGKAEVAVGAGPSGGSRVKVYSAATGTPVAGPLGDFLAFDAKARTGVFVGADALAGDVDADGTLDLAVGTGPGTPGRVKVFSGKTGAVIRDVSPAGAGRAGVRVALAYVDDDPFADVVIGTGPGVPTAVKVYSGKTGLLLAPPMGEYAPFGATSMTGAFVAASNDPLDPVVWYYPINTSVEGQAICLEGGVQGDTIGGVDYRPTGTVTLSLKSTDPGGQWPSWHTIGTAALTPIDPIQAVGDVVAKGMSAGYYDLWVAYSGDGTFQSEDYYVYSAAYVTAGPDDRPPDEECPDPGLVTTPTGAEGRGPGGRSPSGVRYGSGEVKVGRKDLASGGFGTPWGLEWGWTNADDGFADGAAGDGTARGYDPRLVQVNGDDSLALVADADTAYFFDLYCGAYHARFGDPAVLTPDPGNGELVVTPGDGRTLTFYDFSGGTPAGRAGKLKTLTDAAGNVATVTSWDGSGRPTEVQRVQGSGSTALTESFLSTYVSTGANAGKVAAVTQRTKVGTGSWTTVRSASYTYYTTGDNHGRTGDLKFAQVSDAGSYLVDTSYYRYDTTTTKHLMTAAFGPAAYGRLVTALGAGVDSLTDTQVGPYADKALEYDGSGRVTKATDAAAGCSVCSGGQGEFDYAYTDNTSWTGERGPNLWAAKTVETLPDGNTNTVYTNVWGQVLLRKYTDTATSQTWLWYSRYDDNGRLVLSAEPSAVSGYSESNADLVGYSGATATYLRDSEGLVTVYTFAGATTATSSTAGDAAGYLKAVDLKHGETGTAVPQQALTYLKRTVGSQDYFVPAGSTVYRNDNGTGGETTTASYTWQGSTAQPASVTVTRPAVTTAQNGPNAATTTTTVFDTYGRAIWAKDGAGFLTYTAYDTTSGAVTKRIADVDTTQTSTFASLPSGWSTPSGAGLHLTTTYEVDGLGRATKTTHPNGRIDYAVYDDVNHAVRYYPGWDSTANAPTGPTVVTREDRAGNYTETLTMSATPSVSSGRPTGSESVGSLQSLSRSYRNAAGQTTHTDAYFNLSGLTYSTSTSLGTEGTHFYRTEYTYDKQGRPNRTLSAENTIYRTVSDGLGRAVSEWVGTDDTPTSGSWSPTNTTGTDLVKVREYEYDGGGVGDGTLTKLTEHPGGSAADRVAQAYYDWRDRAVAVKRGVEGSESTSVNRPVTYYDYDNLNRVTQTRVYDGDGVTITSTSGVPNAPSSSLLRAQATASYDELGRVYRSELYSVDPSSGSVGSNTLKADTWYDARGLAIKSAMPGGLVQKTTYDGAGRVTTTYATDGGGDSGYSDADDVTGDAVLEQAEQAYDASGNVLTTILRRRFHDETGTGALGTASTGVKARVSYIGYYYDLGDRNTAVVDVGTNAGSAWTRPSSVPSRSDTVLVTGTVYDSAGRVWKTTDPRALETRTTYDALGRVTKTVENYVDGTVSDGDDKTTEYAYNGAGMTSLTAKLTGGSGQTTQWVYGVTTGGGSGITSNDVAGATRWPDPSSGSASSSEQESVTVNALGQTLTSTDRNGTVHTLTYDVLGRVTADAVTTLGSGVDGAVRRVEAAYDGLGNPSLMTTYDAASGGSVVSQVQRAFNGLGQLTIEYQSHSGAVNTSTTPKVQYAYSEMASGANHSRPTSMTYPSGYVLTANYSSGLNSSISRLSSLSDTSGTVESYDYLGLGTVVRRAHSQPGVDLTYIKQSGESNGDAGDQYPGLDRFGRVVDQRWIKTSSGTATDRFQYGYDRDANRLYRDNLVNTAFGELYSYDGLNQVASFDRGTLNGTKTGLSGSAARTQAWDYDALGNWDSVTTNGTAQTRSANKQNEITSIGSLTTPTYDANGNMTGDEGGKQFVYDAWNRLVKVKNSGGTTLKTLAYDGLGRQVSSTVSGTTTDLYYSAQWQVVEEKVGSNTTNRYVWSPVYVDALVLRDRDTDANGTLDERLWAQQDANWNVTALIDGSGAVQERYDYDLFGSVTVLDANWTADADGASDVVWAYLFQGMKIDVTAGLTISRERPVYSPYLGRWVSTDPIGFAGRNENLYGFVNNNPGNMLDPSGLIARRSGYFVRTTCVGMGVTTVSDGPIVNDHPATSFTHPSIPFVRLDPYWDGEPGGPNSKLCQNTIMKSSFVSICRRDLNKAGQPAAMQVLFTIVNVLGHEYVDFGADGRGVHRGCGLYRTNARRGDLPDDESNLAVLPPRICIGCVIDKNVVLPTGKGAGKRAWDASDEEIEDCIRNHRLTSDYGELTYNCFHFAEEATKACGLTCDRTSQHGTRLPR